MKPTILILVLLTLPMSTLMAESIRIDGMALDDIRWGAVTPATVTIYHKTGVATVPLEKLPAELQQRFGYDPAKAAAYIEAEQKRESERIRWLDEQAKRRQQQVILPGRDRNVAPTLGKQRVETNKLTALTGYLAKRGELFMENGQKHTGTLLELAKPKGKLPANPQLQMRPGLWESAGELVFLKDYTATEEPGTLIRLLALPAGEVRGLHAFDVAWEGRTETNAESKATICGGRAFADVK